MRKYIYFSLLTLIVLLSSFNSSLNELFFENNAGDQLAEPVIIRLNAETAKINHFSSEIVEDSRLKNGKGVSLKQGISAAINGERSEPDLVFNVKVPNAGRYVMNTYALTDAEGAELMKNATSKFESLYIKIQIDNKRPTKRVVYVPWDRPDQESGKFEFSGKDQKLKIWLPRGVRLEHIRLATYIPPKVPEQVVNYQPKIVPPSGRPRLWLNRHSLVFIKEGLETGENKAAWEKVKQNALTPFPVNFNPDEEMSYDANLESAAQNKAFYYLMTGERQIGLEAVKLMTGYLSLVEFGNLLDITREIGRAIYTGSLVYDWCYNLLTPSDKRILYENLMRLADDMEMGWPPFKQSIIIGHGNEAQLNRDLLSMSIAIFNENPIPYKYCSYRILEELVPMRNWEYQSPRHNQGVNYGAYRISWDLHAAWLFYRMTGQPVFNDNLKNVTKYWFYMRLPDGQMLRDGDGFQAGAPGEFYYWRNPLTMLLFYSYARDPLVKAEFERQGGLPNDPVLFLLLNDPSIKPEPSFESLPLTMDFGDILGSMIARTGWNIGLTSNDVVAEIKGGGYHFGNHQHSDAGSIQFYYRGFQVGDIGLYGFYGPPYDFNFHKRSIAHSMMLARDPEEKFGNTESNDGGTRFNQRNPKTPQEAQSDPWFNNGKVVSCSFGPSTMQPSFSYFSVDLVGAYSSKIEAYTRNFCFLNLGRDSIPAAIILTDNMVTTNPEFKKYWQINTHNVPEKTSSGVILNNERKGLVGKTHVNMLVPSITEDDIQIFSGSEATTSFGFKYEIPGRLSGTNYPEANGHRIMISPAKANKEDRFLTVFQITAGETSPLPVKYYETETSYVIYLDDRIVSMNKGNSLINKPYIIKIREKEQLQVLLTGLEPGDWNIKSRDGKIKLNANINERENTIFFLAGKGDYLISPGRLIGAKPLVKNETFSPENNSGISQRLYVDYLIE